MPKRKGGSLQANQIQQVLENTYKETDDAPTGYTFDKDLSDDRVKVYKDMNSDQVIVAHRGSKGWRDWLDNARYAYSGDIKTSGTYQDAKSRQQKAIDKYGAKNIISVGHSRAGKYVEELNKEQPVKEVITYNKAVHPNTILQSNPENQTDIRTSTDLVSALAPLQFTKNKTITIPSGYDLLKAHKPSMLSYLGQKLIGKGFKQMRVADMRRFIKAYKKEKFGEKMTGGAKIGKRELVGMLNPILEDDDLDEMVGGNVWTDFVKEFSARHNLKYACALSKYKEPLKKAYKLSKEKKDWYEPIDAPYGRNETTGVALDELGLEQYPNPNPNATLKMIYQHPEYGLRAIRRPYLLKIANKYGLKVDENETADGLRKKITAYENEAEPKKRKSSSGSKSKPKGMTEDEFVGEYDTLYVSNAYYQYYPTGGNNLEKLIEKTSKKDGFIDIDLLLAKGVQIPITTVRKLVLKYGLIPTFEYTKRLIDDIATSIGEVNTVYADEIDKDITRSKTLKAIGRLSKEEMEEAKKGTEPDKEVPLLLNGRPHEFTELLEQMKVLKDDKSFDNPIVDIDREYSLFKMKRPELVKVAKSYKIKANLKANDMINAILKAENLPRVIDTGNKGDDEADYNRLLMKNDAIYYSRDKTKIKSYDELMEMIQKYFDNPPVNLLDRQALRQSIVYNIEKALRFRESRMTGRGMEGGNKWTDFVKDYAKKENTTYGCALTDARIKDAYKLFKEEYEPKEPKKEPKKSKEPKSRQKEEVVFSQDAKDMMKGDIEFFVEMASSPEHLDQLLNDPTVYYQGPEMKAYTRNAVLKRWNQKFVPMEEAIPTEIVLKKITIQKPKPKPIAERKLKPVNPRSDDVDLDEEGTLKERVAKRKQELEPESLYDEGKRGQRERELSRIKLIDLRKMAKEYGIKKYAGERFNDVIKLILNHEEELGLFKQELEPEEMQEMMYRPKLTRELRRALELEIASKPSRLSQLPPIRSDREDELIDTELDELKDIVNDNNIKTKKKSKQALIDAILEHEGEVKGTVLPEDQYKDLELLHIVLKIKNTKGNRSLSALYQNLGGQKMKLKDMRQEKNRNLFEERLQMEKIANMEDYIRFAEKILLK